MLVVGVHVRAETWHYLQLLDRTGLLADPLDPAGKFVHSIYLLPTRLDLLPVHLEGVLRVAINESLGQHFLFIK